MNFYRVFKVFTLKYSKVNNVIKVNRVLVVLF